MESRKLDKLIRYDKNPRKNKEAIQGVLESLKIHGQVKPLVISKAGHPFKDEVICCGHTTLEALELYGAKEAKVVVKEFTDEAEFVDYNIRDNKVSEVAEWDEVILSELSNEFDIDLDAMGFDFEMPEEDYEGETDEDAVPEDAPTVCKLGDLWQLGDHRLLCGDSTDRGQVERLMDGEKADMVFTDPPYKLTSGGNTGTNFFEATIPNYDNGGELYDVPKFEDWLANIYNVLANDSDGYFMSNDKNLEEMMTKTRGAGFDLHNVLVMGKNTHCPNRWYMKNCEFAVYGYKGKAKKINNVGSMALENYEMPTDKVHQAQKPIEFIEGLVLNSSKKDGFVLEPFGGSGSTLIACEKTKRKCRMIELDEKYCDVIIKRWEDFTGKKATCLK